MTLAMRTAYPSTSVAPHVCRQIADSEPVQQFVRVDCIPTGSFESADVNDGNQPVTEPAVVIGTEPRPQSSSACGGSINIINHLPRHVLQQRLDNYTERRSLPCRTVRACRSQARSFFSSLNVTLNARVLISSVLIPDRVNTDIESSCRRRRSIYGVVSLW